MIFIQGRYLDKNSNFLKYAQGLYLDKKWAFFNGPPWKFLGLIELLQSILLHLVKFF